MPSKPERSSFFNFLSICCGEGDEEAKFGPIVDPDDFDWNNEEQESIARQDKARIRQIEHQISEVSHHRMAHCRRTIYSAPIDFTEHFEAPSHPKTPEQHDFLDRALDANFIFMDLSPRERRIFVEALECEHAPKGTTIIEKGHVGDYFYIVESGEVDFRDGDAVVGSCSAGGSFGELALLYDSPRAVTCLATTNVDLWKVDQKTFRHILAYHARSHAEGVKKLLRDIDCFKDLEESDVVRFVHSMTHVHWKAGDHIVRKGEEGTVFYIVEEGRVKIHDIGLGDSQFEDQILGPGQSFGERSLLTGEPRAANVTALTDVTTLAMDRDTFEECIGPLKCRLERNLRTQFVKAVPLFASGNLTEPEINQLVDLMKEVCYRTGEKLAVAGQPYEMNLWVIRKGRLLVYSAKDANKIYNLQSGDYFGDKSIVRSDPTHVSSHTAVCEENLTTWVITRDEIESVIGDISRLGLTPSYTKRKQEKSVLLSDLNKHRILGAGAFGKVWLVSNKETGEPYALKTISKRKLLDAKQVHSVIREKELLCLLQHPFILHLVSSYQDEHNLYLLLPVIPGGELFNVLHKQKTKGRGLSVSAAAFYAACVLEALGHFHQRNVAYRDLKLENILIDEHGFCVIADLGFAKVVTDKTYTLVGTPEYLCPEIIMSKGHNKACDYWSYGVLVYELLVGTSPFYERGSSQMEMFKRIVLVNYKVPTYVDSDAVDLIAKLLVRRPAGRLGNLANGHLDVKAHPWFEQNGINFKQIISKKMEAPWRPETKDPFDASASHFDSYKKLENEVDVARRLTKDEQNVFEGF